MPGICNGLQHLSLCWEPIQQACDGNNMTAYLTSVVSFHRVMCNISNSSSFLIDTFLNTMRDVIKDDADFQYNIQLFSILYNHHDTSIKSTVIIKMAECTKSYLEQTISRIKPAVLAIFKTIEVIIAFLYKYIDVLTDYTDLGLKSYQLNKDLSIMLNALYAHIKGLTELLWIEGGFVTYDPWTPSWWRH